MFDRILVPLDGSTLAECVLPHALTLAQIFEAQLILLGVTESDSAESQAVDPLSWHLRRAESEAYLEGVAGRLQGQGIRVNRVVQEGRAAERIVDFAHEQHIPLILLSSHGRSGLNGWSASSTTLAVALRAHVSMMIIPAYGSTTATSPITHYRRVLLPLDGSRRAECVLPLANALAGPAQSELLAVYVIATPQFPDRSASARRTIQLDRFQEQARDAGSIYLKQLSSRLPGNVQPRLLADDRVPAALQRTATEEDRDLLLLSAHGHGGDNRWPLGHVPLHFIVYGAPCPLLIVQDFEPDEIAPTPVERAVAEQRKGH